MFSFSDQVWKEMQMGEVVTLLTSASGHSLVKSFTGQKLSPQPFSTGKLFNVSEEPVSDLKSLSALLLRLEDDATNTVKRVTGGGPKQPCASQQGNLHRHPSPVVHDRHR